MSALVAACLWAISANLIAVIPWARPYRLHWSLARGLLLALPLVLWLVGQRFGLLWQLAALTVAVFQLRLMLRHMFDEAKKKWSAR